MKECKSKRSSGCQRGGKAGEKGRRQVAEGGDRGGERALSRELWQEPGFQGENIVQ